MASNKAGSCPRCGETGVEHARKVGLVLTVTMAVFWALTVLIQVLHYRTYMAHGWFWTREKNLESFSSVAIITTMLLIPLFARKGCLWCNHCKEAFRRGGPGWLSLFWLPLGICLLASALSFPTFRKGEGAVTRWWLPRTGPVKMYWSGQMTLLGHKGPVTSLAFSSDGKTLATGSEDRSVKLWDAQTGAPQRALLGNNGRVISVAFSPDNGLVASAGADGTIRVWDRASGTLKLPLNKQTFPPGALPAPEAPSEMTAVAFSPDSKVVAGGGMDGAVRLWDVETGELRQALQHPWRIWSVAFSPDGSRLGVGGGRTNEPGGARLWEVKTGKLARALPDCGVGPVWAVAFSPDGKLLVNGWPGTQGTNHVMLVDAHTGSPADIDEVLGARNTSASTIAFRPDGRALLVGCDERVIASDFPGGGQERTRHFSYTFRQPVALSPDCTRAASASLDNTAKIWDISRL